MAETVLQDGNYDRVPFEAVREMIAKTAEAPSGPAKTAQFTDKARALMGSFPDSPYQRALLAVTGLVTDRDH